MQDKPQRDKPWIFRTYAGHSTAKESNALYRQEPVEGPDRPVRRRSICRPRPATIPIIRSPQGEVGKVGVPISHIGDMRALARRDSAPAR
jgi:(2R)-ethylmalonyl-CoA mutase